MTSLMEFIIFKILQFCFKNNFFGDLLVKYRKTIDIWYIFTSEAFSFHFNYFKIIRKDE